MFRKFLQNKLWRDKAVTFLEKEGSKVHWRRLDTLEFIQELKKKLLEEAEEVYHAKNPRELFEELADVLEIIDCLAQTHGSNLQEIEAIRLKKFEKRGGFFERKYVTIAEHPLGSFGEKYCLADPKKYPEVRDTV